MSHGLKRGYHPQHLMPQHKSRILMMLTLAYSVQHWKLELHLQLQERKAPLQLCMKSSVLLQIFVKLGYNRGNMTILFSFQSIFGIVPNPYSVGKIR